MNDKTGEVEKQFAMEIAEFFGFKSIDDATLRLPEILRHYKQEKLEKEYSCSSEKVVFYVHNSIWPRKPEKKAVGYCGHFSRLLAEIGNAFSPDSCSIVVCHPDYLNGHEHFIVHDVEEGRFRDASIYRVAFNGKKWVPVGESGLDRNNLPEGILNIELELPRAEYRQHDWLAMDFLG